MNIHNKHMTTKKTNSKNRGKYILLLIFLIPFISSCEEAKQRGNVEINFNTESEQYRNVKTKNLSPYALFGDSTVVLMTEEEYKNVHITEVFNSNEDAEIAKLVFENNTGFVNIYNKQGKLIDRFLMDDRALAKFISVDPLADDPKQIGTSPYAYVANNPITRIDPDGRKWEIAMHQKDGKTHYSLNFTGKVLNETGKDIDMNSAVERITAGMNQSYNGKDGNVSWSINVDVQVANSKDDIGADDHVFKIVGDDNGLVKEGKPGLAEHGSLTMLIHKSVLKNEINNTDENHPSFGTGLSKEGLPTLERTASHEAGHTGWFLHPDEHIEEPTNSKHHIGKSDFKRNGVFKNLMFQSKDIRNTGMNLIDKQLESMYLNRNALNKTRRK
jgi:hypothetical protein